MAEAILLGPFGGGLNIASDPSAVQDNDLVIMDNFDMELDKSLVSRPPIINTGVSLPTGSLTIIGVYYRTGSPYLIASDGNTSTYYFNGTSWVLITNTLSAVCMAQFKDKAWLVANPNGSQNGGSWDPTSGFLAVPSMPRGGCIAVSKERLWIGGGKNAITNGSRVTYCGPSAPTSWPASTPAGGGFIEVSGGDGQNVVEIINYYNDLAIFKEHSTYRFSYASSPDGGQVTPMDTTIGCMDAGCVVKYRSSIYVLYGESLYELTNASFIPINMKVPFKDQQAPDLKRRFSVSAWDGRVFVQYSDRTYVLGVDTQTWATWTSDVTGPIGRVVSIAVTDDDEPFAFIESAKSTGANNRNLYRIEQEPSNASENIACRIRTKIYDYQVSHSWKRLMFWGVDLNAPGSVEAKVLPISSTPGTLWRDLTVPWNSPLLGTWANLLDQPLDVSDSVSITGVRGPRKFIKFLKSLRFRQVYFELTLHTNGTAISGPAKIFTITTWVGVKQLVAKKTN